MFNSGQYRQCQQYDNKNIRSPIIMSNITSPMPGKITKILVRIGDRVTSDTQVIIHEAMKMENSIFAACDGIIQEIKIKEGDAVETNQILLTIG